MIIIEDNIVGMSNLKYFYAQFEMKDFDSFIYFLGLGITSYSNDYFLSQVKNALDLSCTPTLDGGMFSTPLDLNIKLKKLDGEPFLDPTLYHQLVDSLANLTIIQLDLSFVVSLVSQFMYIPHIAHYLLYFESFNMFELQYVMALNFHQHFLFICVFILC